MVTKHGGADKGKGSHMGWMQTTPKGNTMHFSSCSSIENGFRTTNHCWHKDKGHSQLLMDGFDLRISPRNNDVYQNPEEPEDEDEDVQMERMRTANALVSTSFDELSTQII